MAPSVEAPLGRPGSIALRIGIALVVVVASALVAESGLPEWEEDVFEALNTSPSWLEHVLWAPMQLGSLWGPLLVALVSWLAWRRWRPSVGALVAGIVAWQLAKVVKSAVERGRPHAMVDEFARLGGTPYEGLGFVSGHAAVAMSLAAVLSPYLGRVPRAAAYAVALLVGYARVQVSAHLPLDVVGGAALGYLVGWAWNLAVGVPVPAGGEGSGEGSVERAPQDAQTGV